MDKDRIKGSAEQAKGKVKKVAGKALGDSKFRGMRMKNKSGVFLLALIFVATNVASTRAGTLNFAPNLLTVSSGQSFSIDVKASNVTDLYAYQFDVGFDPTILAAVSIVEGPFLATGGPTFFVPGTIDNVGGSISYNADTLIGAVGVTGTGVLTTIDFTALAGGSSAISLSNALFLDSNLNTIVIDLTGGTVDVNSSLTTSDLPASWTEMLLALGVFGIAVYYRRTRTETELVPAS